MAGTRTTGTHIVHLLVNTGSHALFIREGVQWCMCPSPPSPGRATIHRTRPASWPRSLSETPWRSPPRPVPTGRPGGSIPPPRMCDDLTPPLHAPPPPTSAKRAASLCSSRKTEGCFLRLLLRTQASGSGSLVKPPTPRRGSGPGARLPRAEGLFHRARAGPRPRVPPYAPSPGARLPWVKGLFYRAQAGPPATRSARSTLSTTFPCRPKLIVSTTPRQPPPGAMATSLNHTSHSRHHLRHIGVMPLWALGGAGPVFRTSGGPCG